MIPSGSSCLCGGSNSVLSPEDLPYDSALKKDPNHCPLIDESTDLPVCDYDQNPTPLYQALEAHQWGAVARFLKTGIWPGHFFSDSKTPKEQVKTWIHRYNHDTHQEITDDDDDQAAEVNTKTSGNSTYHFKGVEERARLNRLRRTGKRVLRWRQLPLHAGLIFMAPPSIVKQLVELFPYALRCPDDKGMLPLHLAFRQAVPDDILTVLLRLFPNGMHVRDQKGRLPVECVRMDLLSETTGPPAVRGMIIQSIMQQSKEKFSQEQQQTVHKFQSDVQSLQAKMEQLESQLNQVNHREEQTRTELTSTLEELQALKKHHRKLQELQQLSLQRQSEHEVVEKHNFDFQQRIMEQLQWDARDDHQHHHHHHRRSNRDHRRQHNHQSPLPPPHPVRTPSTAPSLPRQESNSRYSSSGRETSPQETDRAPTPSSYSEPLFNKYHVAPIATTGVNPIHGNGSDEQNISFSSGGSQYSSDFTKPHHPPAGTAPSTYTGLSSQYHHHYHRHRNNNNLSPNPFKPMTSRDSYTTKLTRDTAYTNTGYYYSDAETDDEALGGGALGGGVLGRRPKATASAVHKQPLQTSASATATAGGHKKTSSEEQQKQAGNSMCNSPPQSPFDNWDFSGIFKPLAVKGELQKP